MKSLAKNPLPRKPSRTVPGRGRPTAYKAEYCAQVYKLCLMGAIDSDLAEFFEVGEATINRWKIAHSEFRESIKRGKLVADANVAQALYQAATGGGIVTETKEQLDAGGNLLGRTTEIKQMPASTTAMIFWLKNRQPDKWRDRVESDVTFTSADSEHLHALYLEKMSIARERQADIVKDRGGLLGAVMD